VPSAALDSPPAKVEPDIAMTQRMTNQRGEEIVTYTSKILAGRRSPAGGARHG